jgi:hypothetical protein
LTPLTASGVSRRAGGNLGPCFMSMTMDKQAAYSQSRAHWRWLLNLPGPKAEPTMEEASRLFPSIRTSAADVAAVHQLHEGTPDPLTGGVRAAPSLILDRIPHFVLRDDLAALK